MAGASAELLAEVGSPVAAAAGRVQIERIGSGELLSSFQIGHAKRALRDVDGYAAGLLYVLDRGTWETTSEDGRTVALFVPGSAGDARSLADLADAWTLATGGALLVRGPALDDDDPET